MFFLFFFLGEISYIATLVNPRWNKGDVMWCDVNCKRCFTNYKLRHSPQYCVFVRKRILFDVFSPLVHATCETTENADENGDFRERFQKWSLSKTHCFENNLFLVWVDRWKQSFLKQCHKKTCHILPLSFRWSMVTVIYRYLKSLGQTIATFQRNISEHCWVQYVACVCPPCCDGQGVELETTENKSR